MSDWENMDDNEIQIVKKIDGFEDEKSVVTVDLEKQPTSIETKPVNPEKQKAKDQIKKLEKNYNDKQIKVNDALHVDDPRAKASATEKKRGEELSKESDLRNTMDLLDGISAEYKKELGILEKISLKSEEEAKDLAKKIAQGLVKPVGVSLNNQEFLKLFVKEFCCELLQEVSTKLTSKEFDEILKKVKVLFNAKEKEEKDKEKSKKGGKNKPTANLGKGTKGVVSSKYEGDDDEDYDYDDYDYNQKFTENDFM